MTRRPQMKFTPNLKCERPKSDVTEKQSKTNKKNYYCLTTYVIRKRVVIPIEYGYIFELEKDMGDI